MITKKYLQHRETVHNLIWRIFQIGGKQGVILLIFLLSAQFLSPFEFGIYNYSLTIVFLLILFGDFGISTATSKYVAEYTVVSKKKLKAVIFNSGILIFTIALLVFLLVLFLGPGYLGSRFVYIFYLLPLVFLAPMTSLYDGVYRGMKKFKQLAIISFLVAALSSPVVYFFVRRYGLEGALISQVFFYFVLLLSLAFGYGQFHLRFNKKVIREIGGYSFAYGLAILGNYLFIRFGILILGHYNYIEEIAVYELINKIFTVLLMPFTLLGQVVAPNFAAFSARGHTTKIYTKALNYTFFFFLSGLILGILASIFLPFFFETFFLSYFSKSYFEATFLLSIIIFVANVWAATFDAGILIPTGYAHLMAKFYIVLGIFGSLLSLFLVTLLGYIGVIVSLAVSSIIMSVGLRIMYFYKLKLAKV